MSDLVKIIGVFKNLAQEERHTYNTESTQDNIHNLSSNVPKNS